MTYFPDLAPCKYFSDSDSDKLRAVGWLDGTHPFPTAPIDGDLVLRLFVLAERPWEPRMFMGYHLCEICEQPGKYLTTAAYQSRRLTVGAHNLFIPGDGVIYAAPTMILHYILAHEYRPPDEFAKAVRACPAMMTHEYLEALKRNGLDELASYLDDA